MDIGEMFFIPNKTKNTVSSYASTSGKALGRKFTTRLCYMRETLAGWEPASKDDDGAVLGVGVWRLE